MFYYYCCNTFVCEQGKNYINKFLKLVCRMRLRWRWRWRRSDDRRHRVSHEFQNDGIGSGAAVTNLASYASRPSTVDTTCGRAGHLGSDKESETKPEPATSTGKRFSLFIATPLIWQAGAQSRSPASTPFKYPFASQLHCPSFPHSLIYIQTYLSTSLHQSQLNLQLLLRLMSSLSYSRCIVYANK